VAVVTSGAKGHHGPDAALTSLRHLWSVGWLAQVAGRLKGGRGLTLARRVSAPGRRGDDCNRPRQRDADDLSRSRDTGQAGPVARAALV